MNPVGLSIVIPAHNVEETIERTVHSALGSSRRLLEVIVVNDGSSDQTAARIALIHDSRVSVVTRVHAGGPAVARNEGLDHARGEFVTFLDGDDLLLPGSLDQLIDAFSPRDVMSMGKFIAVNEDDIPLDIGTWSTFQLQPMVRRSRRWEPCALNSESILSRLVTPPPGAIVLRREVVIAVGAYRSDIARSEDLEFLVRVLGQGPAVLVDENVLRYRRTPTQRSQATRQRRWGRLRTLMVIMKSSPSPHELMARGRGIVSHHLERAELSRQTRQWWPALRSMGAVIFFWFWLVACSPPVLTRAVGNLRITRS